MVEQDSSARLHPFDCPSCGAPLHLSVGSAVPVCTHCGKELGEPAPVASRELDVQFQQALSRHERIAEGDVTGWTCSECGAVVANAAGNMARCEFCGSSHLVLTRQVLGTLKPDGMLLPKLTRAEALERIVAWCRAGRLQRSEPWVANTQLPLVLNLQLEDLKAIWLPLYDFELTVDCKPDDFKPIHPEDGLPGDLPLPLKERTRPYPALARGVAPQLWGILRAPRAEPAPFMAEALAGYHLIPANLDPAIGWKEMRLPLDLELYERYERLLRQQNLVAQVSYNMFPRQLSFRLLLAPLYICLTKTVHNARVAVAVDPVDGQITVYAVDDAKLAEDAYGALIHGFFSERPTSEGTPEPEPAQPVAPVEMGWDGSFSLRGVLMALVVLAIPVGIGLVASTGWMMQGKVLAALGVCVAGFCLGALLRFMMWE